MAKRQTRIPGLVIPEKWPDISGKKVNIVLTNGSVLLADLLAINAKEITIRNMRRKTQTLNISQIAEIILDY